MLLVVGRFVCRQFSLLSMFFVVSVRAVIVAAAYASLDSINAKGQTKRVLLHLLTLSRFLLILFGVLWASITCEYSSWKSEQLATATHQLSKLLHKLVSVSWSWCETRTPAADTDKWHLSRQPDYRVLVTSPRLQVWGRRNLPTNQVDTSCEEWRWLFLYWGWFLSSFCNTASLRILHFVLFLCFFFLILFVLFSVTK